MNKVLIIIAIAIALCSMPLMAAQGASASDAAIIPIGSEAYSFMDLIYALSGNGTPSNARPWSHSEARLILSRVKRDSLPEPARKLYDTIDAIIEDGFRWSMSEGAGFGAHLFINPAIHTHANADDFTDESDWVLDFEKRQHFLKAAVEMGIGSFFYSYCDLLYGYGIYTSHDSDAGTIVTIPAFLVAQGGLVDPTHVGALAIDADSQIGTSSYLFSKEFLFNWPDASKNFDFIWPKRAVFSIGGRAWNLDMSRDRISWGNSHIGNFIVDDHVDFNNYIRFDSYSNRFKYEFLVLFAGTVYDSGEGATAVDKISKMLLAHRLEFRFAPWLTFAISEDVMYQVSAADGGIINLSYLNPSFIYHNLNNRSMFNAIAHAELDLQLLPGLSIYTQFCLDQARAPNEGSEQQDAWGILGGIEAAATAGKMILSSSLELACTTPLLYRRDAVDFLTVNRTWAYGSGGGHVAKFDYIGFPYGGDAIALDWRGSITIPQAGRIDMNIRAMEHGEMSMYQSHNSGGDNTGKPDRELSTPSGDRIQQMLYVSLRGEAKLGNIIPSLSFPEVSFWAQLDWIGRRIHVKSNDSYEDLQSDTQFSAGFGIKL